MFSQISDKLLQINLYSWSTAMLANIAGIINLSAWGEMLTYDEVMRFAALISAMSGAIYGIYKIADLIVVGVKKLENKINNKRNDRKGRKRSK